MKSYTKSEETIITVFVSHNVVSLKYTGWFEIRVEK